MTSAENEEEREALLTVLANSELSLGASWGPKEVGVLYDGVIPSSLHV